MVLARHLLPPGLEEKRGVIPHSSALTALAPEPCHRDAHRAETFKGLVDQRRDDPQRVVTHACLQHKAR